MFKCIIKRRICWGEKRRNNWIFSLLLVGCCCCWRCGNVNEMWLGCLVIMPDRSHLPCAQHTDPYNVDCAKQSHRQRWRGRWRPRQRLQSESMPHKLTIRYYYYWKWHSECSAVVSSNSIFTPSMSGYGQKKIKIAKQWIHLLLHLSILLQIYPLYWRRQ